MSVTGAQHAQAPRVVKIMRSVMWRARCIGAPAAYRLIELPDHQFRQMVLSELSLNHHFVPTVHRRPTRLPQDCQRRHFWAPHSY